MENNKKTISNSIKWSAIEKLSSQLIQFGIMILLARILGPKSLGLIGMIAIFISISQIFIDSGFYAALIRKEKLSNEDLSTAFTFNFIISLICYTFIWFIAPLVSEFYNEQLLTTLLRCLALSIIFNSLSIVQRSILTRDMDFRKQAKISIVSSILSGSVTLYLAYMGYGVWVLVIQNIMMSFINTLLLNIMSEWRIKFGFSYNSFSDLFSFGGKLLLSSVIDSVYNNIFQIIIGKIYSVEQLGFYTQAKQLSNVPIITLTTIIQRVSYPTLSKINIENMEILEKTHSRFIRMTALIIFPIYLGMSLNSGNIINILLGNKWDDASVLLSALAIGFMLYPINALNLNIINVKGRSDIFLKLEVIKKAIFTVMIVFTYNLGVLEMCISFILMSFLESIINIYYVGQLSKYNIIKLTKDITPILIISITISFASFLISSQIKNEIFSLIMYVLIFISLYLIVVFLYDKSLLKPIKSFILKRV